MSSTSFTNGVAITTNDSTLFSRTRAIYVGGTGDVKVTMAGEGASVVTFKAVPVGTVLMISVVQVFATGTTATNLVALR